LTLWVTVSGKTYWKKYRKSSAKNRVGSVKNYQIDSEPHFHPKAINNRLKVKNRRLMELDTV
jgi:hypothetical protein